jgi:N6-adenosine-specific RNA methylase IME4
MSSFSPIRHENPGTELEFHPLANAYPLLEGESRSEFEADIVASGVKIPIVLYEGKILDGRNRYRAAIKAGLTIPVVDYMWMNPEAVVRSLNDMRREGGLPVGPRALIAAQMANAPNGRPEEKHGRGAGFMTTEQAAFAAGISERSVRQAKAVLRDGTEEVVEAVRSKAISLKAAGDVAKLPVEMQAEIIRQIDPKVQASFLKDFRVSTQTLKKAKRAVRESELAAKIEALPEGKYGVILADPEWSFEVYSAETGMDRSADNHYPTSATDVIAARDVASIAADDSVLFLWATVPMLPDALRVMEAWGFTYKSQMVWVKDRIGTGYWFRNQHEILLVGTRGGVPAPAMGDQVPSVMTAPVGVHSAKPEAFLDVIVSYYPNLPKIELNRRGPARPGWSAWGNESQ